MRSRGCASATRSKGRGAHTRELQARYAALDAALTPEPNQLVAAEVQAAAYGRAGNAPAVEAVAGKARAAIERIRGEARDDPAHAYNDHDHPEHQALHAQVRELYRQATGGAAGADAYPSPATPE